MARNTYKEDELLEEPFDIKHLLRAWVYIRKFAGQMILALILSAIGGATALVSPIIVERALDVAIPDGNVRMLFTLVLWLIFFYLLSIIFFTVRSRIMVKVSQDIIYNILQFLYHDIKRKESKE